MFCKKCGAFVDEDSNFCPVCGEKVSSPMEASGDTVSFHDVNIANKTQEEASVRSFVYESEQKEANRLLFRIYELLIPPVREIENHAAKIQANEKTIFCAKGRRSSFGSNPCFVVILYIAYFIFLFFKLPYNAISGYQTSSESGVSILWFPFRSRIWEKASRENVAVDIWLLQSLILTALTIILVRMLINIYYRISAKKIESELMKENENLFKEEQVLIKAVSPYLKYVPPKYRTSERLTFFVDDYQNCKVDNLKEAVLLCDQEEFNMQVVSELKGIRYEIEAQTAVLSDIRDSLNNLESETAFVGLAAVVF